jgi:hypothetical protein
MSEHTTEKDAASGEYPFLTDEERCHNWLPDSVSHFGDMRCADRQGHEHRKHYFGPVTWSGGEWRVIPPAVPEGGRDNG